MLKLAKQENILQFLMTRCEDGLKQKKSKFKKQKVVIDDIISILKKHNLTLANQLYIQEFLQKNNKQNLSIKLNLCKKNSQNIQSFQILDLDSTKTEKDLMPFWTSFSQIISNKLWLPQKIDSQDLISNCSKTFLINSMPRSQVYLNRNIDLKNKNYQKILCQLSLSSQQDIMEEEVIKKEIILKTRKIRIYPTTKQKIFYNKCFGATRYVYNKILEFVNNNKSKIYTQLDNQSKNGCTYYDKTSKQYCCQQIKDKYFCKKHNKSKIDFGFSLNIGSLRKNSKLFTAKYIKENPWLKNIPYDTRQLVINDFIAAYKAAITNLKNGNIKGFEMKFKSIKQNTCFFHIDKRAVKKDITIFKNKKLGKNRVRSKMKKWYDKNINDKITNNCKIIRYRPGIYYLLLTVKGQVKNENFKMKCVSLDPGVRTFQSFYSPDGIVGKLGDNFINNNTMKHAIKIDKLNSVKKKIKNKRTIRNIIKRQFLLRTKIKNAITDLHWQTTCFLCKNFETIIIPKFGCKNMSNKKISINSKISRKMLMLSHGSFLEKLKTKCKEYKRKLIIVNEAYTSKTCTHCGNIKNDLGGNKNYNCLKCKLKIDRDYNGARNILLKTVCKNLDTESI